MLPPPLRQPPVSPQQAHDELARSTGGLTGETCSTEATAKPEGRWEMSLLEQTGSISYIEKSDSAVGKKSTTLYISASEGEAMFVRL